MATRTQPKGKPAAAPQRRAEPAEKKLPGVPSHLQAAVQQLVGNQSAPAAQRAGKRGA